MKKYLAVVSFALIIGSCKNDIDITADYKETPVIYGVLSIDSATHYIKVYKAFLDEETGAIDIAKNADSIYYTDSIILYIENQNSGQRTYLSKIDGNDIGRPMEDGIFANSPNILYTFNHNLNKDDTYVLYFENPRTGKTAQATTRLVKDFQINYPFEGFRFNFALPAASEIQWRSAANGKINDVTLRFLYWEWHVNNPSDSVLKHADWKIARNIIAANTIGGEQLAVSIDGESFYNFLKNAIPANTEMKRKAPADCIEMYIETGGDVLYNYIRVNQAQSGITSLQTLTEYTNVDGGLGILSSRKTSKKAGIGLTDRSLDSLSCSAITKELNFVNFNCF